MPLTEQGRKTLQGMSLSAGDSITLTETITITDDGGMSSSGPKRVDQGVDQAQADLVRAFEQATNAGPPSGPDLGRAVWEVLRDEVADAGYEVRLSRRLDDGGRIVWLLEIVTGRGPIPFQAYNPLTVRNKLVELGLL